MKRKDVAVLVLCSVIAFVCARPVEFTEDTLEEFISEDDAWLILFKKGGKAAEQGKLLEEVAKELDVELGPVKVGSVDCSKYPDPCLDYGVKKRYPFVTLSYYGLVQTGHQLDSSATVADEVKWVFDHVDENVVRLGDNNYDSVVGEKGSWMIVFTQDLGECWLCKSYHTVASSLSVKANRQDLFKVGRVLCPSHSEHNRDVCSRFGMYRNESVIFPTVRYVQDGQVHKYDASVMPRTEEPLIQWVQRLKLQAQAKAAHPPRVERPEAQQEVAEVQDSLAEEATKPIL